MESTSPGPEQGHQGGVSCITELASASVCRAGFARVGSRFYFLPIGGPKWDVGELHGIISDEGGVESYQGNKEANRYRSG
ncbi:hypothetical protein EMIT093MI4_70236 [Pseudomonas sp. IT-93MI4]